MDTKKIAGLAMIACCALLFAMPASAAQIINGSFGGLGYATVSFTNLNFCPNGSTPNGANQGGACGAGTGNIQLAGGAGSFSGVSGTLNTIQSLNSGAEPIGATVSLANWMVFNPAVGSPNISLTLTSVLAGTFTATDCFLAPAAGQTCTPGVSAFNLQNQSANSSSATFQIIGNAVDGAGGISPFTAVFSSQFNVPYQTLLAGLANGGANNGNYSSAYSVSVTTASPIPEPATLSMMGIGLLGLGLIARRRKS